MNWAAIASLLVGLIITIVGIVLGWYVIPNIVEEEIAENVRLNNDTDQYERFEELPIPLDFKVYILNVENPDEINNGDKPIVKEIGPYIYKQSRKKENITWTSNNRISYYEYQYFEFDGNSSGNLTENDTVTVLNPALNGAIQILEITNLTFILPMLSRTVQETFGVNNIFLTISVGDFLFNGYTICDLNSIEDIANKTAKLEAKIACLGLFVMPTKNIAPVIEGKRGKLVFTFLGHKKDKHDGRYTINSGVNHVKETAMIEKWQDEEYLSSWKGNTSTCNKVRGRDAVIFEPYLTEKSTLTVFNTDICRTVDLHFTNDVKFRDASAFEYRLGKDVLQTSNEDNSCYCLNITKSADNETRCLNDGLLELFTCYNAPILLSYPHFLWADDEYKDAVDGLADDVEKHKTFAVIEPNTGTPLGGAKRVQFNMYINYNGHIDFLTGFENNSRLVPMIWLDEGFTINDELYGILYDLYISKTFIITAVTWSVIGLGIAVMVITIVVTCVLQRIKSKQSV